MIINIMDKWGVGYFASIFSNRLIKNNHTRYTVLHANYKLFAI